jgi:signal transduction histidine kinase
VVKHSNASRSYVTLTFETESLQVSTVDNGIGFDLSAPRPLPTLGMSSMRERADAVGGRLTIESALGRGTRLTAHLPIPNAD